MADLDERLHEIATELYRLRPDRFTAARTAASIQARDAGDKELAAAVKALRRPGVAAYVVNLLVSERAELVEQVVTLGVSLREAQSALQGDALRELSRQRRQLVIAVAEEARALGRAQGQNVTESAVRQVEETLHAAMADPAAAEAVASGLLTQPLSSTGLESLTDSLAVAPTAGRRRTPTGRALSVVPDAAGADDAASEEEQLAAARAEAEAELSSAREALATAERKRAKATTRKHKAEARLLELEARLEELRRHLAELEAEAEAAADEVEALDVKVTKADLKVERAQEQLTAARGALQE